MCGRYSITGDLAELEKLVRFICKVVDFKPLYNLAPRAIAPVLIWEGGTATLKPMRWGLIPSWSKDETIGDKLTNARADTITEKPSYRRPFEKQRCLIPADGFYEWLRPPTPRKRGDVLRPFLICRRDGAPPSAGRATTGGGGGG
jgi:putative SOS response-associated peptidase YedK